MAVGPYLHELSPQADQQVAIDYMIDQWGLSRKFNDGGQSWITGLWQTVGYNHVLMPNDDHAGLFNKGFPWWINYGCVPPTSHHAGGVVTSFCDGSTRKIADTIDRNLWLAMGSRSGNNCGTESYAQRKNHKSNKGVVHGPVLNFVSGERLLMVGGRWGFGRETESRSGSGPASSA